MRVLITGGGGFLAEHLLAHLQTTTGVTVHSLSRAECDLSRDKEKLSSRLASFQPDRVFHLAGRINGSESELFRDNHRATKNLLEAAGQMAPGARIVLGSTTAVYRCAGTAAAPLSEDQPAGPQGYYACSKYAAEQEGDAYAGAGGWLVTARMSNPVGAHMSPALLCGTLAQQIVEIEREKARQKAPVLALRDLRPKRDFISANDCVRALWHLSEFGTPGTTYNVASGDSISIAEMVNLFLELARVRPIEVRAHARHEERSSVQEQWLSNARLRALGWKPEQTLRQAVSDQLDAERNRS